MNAQNLLTSRTQLRLALHSGPAPDGPEDWARWATQIVGNGPVVDRWRLVVLIASFEGVLDLHDAARVCQALPEAPALDDARAAVADLDPAVQATLIQALEALDGSEAGERG